MKGRVTLTVAALATTLLGISAQANDFTGRELQSQAEASRVEAKGRNRINWRGEIGYRWINRTFEGTGNDVDLDSHELGGALSGYYRSWFLTGGYSHSISSDEIFGADTDTWGANVQAGYQFHIDRNFTVAPFLGWSWTNTSVDGGFGANDADLGVGGLNFGVGFKWTPGYRASKPYPKWSVFGAFSYFPSLDGSDDLDDAGVDGDNGWAATIGVEHNFNARTFANLYYQYAKFSADGPFGTEFDQRDHRVGVTAGLRF